MTFNLKNTKPEFTFFKKAVTSGASRSINIIKTKLPLHIKYPKLMYRKKWNAGRSRHGHLVMWTKGTKNAKNRLPLINYKFRLTAISIIGGFFLIPNRNRLLSLVFNSTGRISFIPTSSTHEVFKVVKFKSMFKRKNLLRDQLKILNPYVDIPYMFYTISQLPKNTPVSLLELKPEHGIQYVRSTGSVAKILKMDMRISTSLVKLPSGVKKVFSTYSIGSLGSVALPYNRKLTNTKAGHYYNFGKKPHVRGVAMNPVDHPHGGRTKAIRYPRTPWGKTTKYK